MVKVTIRKIGNSLGVIIPIEVTTTLRVREGDVLFLTESPDGVRLTPYDPEFERQMTVASEGIQNYRNALRELAK